ncbi:MAG: response regulator transcription factor [Clostridia bacterium]|nr:response regulator transcription factor [Clostridia bacterium]
MKKILIVEDDTAIAELERDYLELNGFECSIAERGTKGLEAALENDYDLILLDIMLPGMDGFEVCSKLREKKQTPVIFLSAKSDDIDKIRGLGLGADDYMTKPFSPNELVARVKAHISRYERLSGQDEIINFGKVSINTDARRVFIDGKEAPFTAKEYDLLLYLVKNKGKTVPKEVLFDKIWGFEAIGDISTVTVHIQRIRDKLGDENRIQTVWGVGYRFTM